MYVPGADPGFQVRGAHLKKLRQAERGAKILGYFVWKITILRQKIIFFPIAEGGANIFGIFHVKNHYFTPNRIFSNFRGARAGCAPPPPPPPGSAPVYVELRRYVNLCNILLLPPPPPPFSTHPPFFSPITLPLFLTLSPPLFPTLNPPLFTYF